MQQRMKRGAKRALAMAVTVCLLVMASACTEPKLAADSFDDFCTRVIREMVGEDYVTIHFFFDDPRPIVAIVDPVTGDPRMAGFPAGMNPGGNFA